MARLAAEKCVLIRGEEPTVSADEMSQFKSQVPEWEVVEREGVKQLQRVFKFWDFKHALAFTDRVGELAEEQGHHPALLTEWGQVTVTWWTHKIGGLHRNDYIMAAKTDLAYGHD